jgi:hypothetical protein
MKIIKKFLRRAGQKALYIYKNAEINRKIAHIYKLNKKIYEGSCDQKNLMAHKNKWSVLKKGVNGKWFKVFSTISDNNDINFVPEDIYYLIIEPKMNNPDFILAYKDKNLYEKRYDKNLFPKTLLRNIDGVYYDRDYRPLVFEEINNPIYKCLNNESTIIIKPTVASGGGANVQLFRKEKDLYVNSKNEALSLNFLRENYRKNFIIQAYLNQHSYFRQFNCSSINTVRIFTYRSVRTEETKVLHAVQRVGRSGSIVDNQASGGISCGINRDGKLNDFAVDKYGRVYKASDSGLLFRNAGNVPKFDEMKRIAKDIAGENFYARLLGFDFCVDNDDNIKLIEINNKNLEINFLQMNNGPLFDVYTDEVIEYCLKTINSHG